VGEGVSGGATEQGNRGEGEILGGSVSGCEVVRQRLIAHHEGELATEERLQVEAHLATCEDCTREAGLIRDALGRVLALPVPEPPAGFWEDFGATVRRRIAAEHPPRPAPWARVAAWLSQALRQRRIPALAAATALGLLLVIGLVRTHRAPRDLPPVEALMISEDLAIGQNLEVLENLDVLEDVEVLERLDLLRHLDRGRRPRLS